MKYSFLFSYKKKSCKKLKIFFLILFITERNDNFLDAVE